MATVEEKVQQLEGQQTASGLILRDHRQRIEAIEAKLGISLPSEPAPEPPPAPAPGPAPAPVVVPSDDALRSIVRDRFIALTTANGYAGGRVPGEEPVGTTVGNAVSQWVELARNLYADAASNDAALAALEARIVADVATYYPPQAAGPGPAPAPAPGPVIETPAPAFAYKTRTKRALISLVGSDGDGTGSEARPFRTIRGAMAKMGSGTEYIVRSTDDLQSRSAYSSFGGTPLQEITIRPEHLYGVTLKGSAQPQGSIDGNCLTLGGGDRDIEFVGFKVEDWMDKWGNGTFTITGDVDGVRVASILARNNGGGSAPSGPVDGHDHLIYLGHGKDWSTAPRNLLFENIDSVGPTDRRIGAILAHLYAADGYGARDVVIRRAKARGLGVWGFIISPNYDGQPCNISIDADIEGDFRDAAGSFWYGDKGRAFTGGVDASCVIQGRYVNTAGQQFSYPTVTASGRSHRPTISLGASPTPAPAPVPTPPPAPAPSPAPFGQDEVPSIALVRDRMERGRGHEVMPSIAETFPSWGILSNVVFNLATNPQGRAYASNPPHVSERTAAMPWFVLAGILNQPNAAINAATRIWLARSFLWLRDGRILVSEGHDAGSMTRDAGLLWTANDPAPTFVNGNRSIIRYVGNKTANGGVYAGRNWHPTQPTMIPGGRLRDSVVACLNAVQFGAVPIDANRTFDFDKLNNSIYAGEDNYSPQQDGFSGRFLKVQPWKRWAFAFEGDWGVLSSAPPNLPGWAG